MTKTFAVDVARFAQKTKISMDLVVQRLTFQVFRDIVMKTPVDTGAARANWQVGITFPPDGKVEAVDKSGGATVAGVAQTVSAIRAGGITYIVNNLPYVMALEFGSSKQAPQGMVRTTLASIESSLGRAMRGA